MKNINIVILIIFIIFLIISPLKNIQSGIEIKNIFLDFAFKMLMILPPILIIISLFESWVKKETIIKHLGEKSSFLSYFWILILASTTVGGIFTSLPIALMLKKKGASDSNIFSFIILSCIVRIPMTFYEASFVGIKFSILRIGICIPLSFLSGKILSSLSKIK